MRSQFDKQTSEGLYIFDQDDVFEALTMWCAKKGIILDKNAIHHYDCTATVEVEGEVQSKGFIIDIALNNTKRKAG